jgi:hypothetical protein
MDSKKNFPYILGGMALLVIVILIPFITPDVSNEITSKQYEKLQEYIDDPVISPMIEWYLYDGKITDKEYEKLYIEIEKKKAKDEVERISNIKEYFIAYFKNKKEVADERESSKSH